MRTTMPPGLAEQTEIEAYADFAADAPASVREALGIGSLRVGSALALAIREDPSCFFNRAGGFGVGAPVTADVLAQACGFYRDHGVSKGALMIAPPLLPPDWAATAGKLNLTKGSRFTKLGCATETALSAADGVVALDPGLCVGPVEPHHAPEWATVMMTTFGFTALGMTDMAAACVGRPNWRQYAVWDGMRIIAVGSIFFNGECAGMFGAATIPEGPGDHSTSLQNMLRAGFEPLYDRVTWLWQRVAGSKQEGKNLVSMKLPVADPHDPRYTARRALRTRRPGPEHLGGQRRGHRQGDGLPGPSAGIRAWRRAESNITIELAQIRPSIASAVDHLMT